MVIGRSMTLSSATSSSSSSSLWRVAYPLLFCLPLLLLLIPLVGLPLPLPLLLGVIMSSCMLLLLLLLESWAGTYCCVFNGCVQEAEEGEGKRGGRRDQRSRGWIGRGTAEFVGEKGGEGGMDNNEE